MTTGLPCDGLDLAVDRVGAALRFTVPRSCLGYPRWVRAGASLQAMGRGYARDQWGERADAPNPYVGPLGPKVTVG